MADELKKDSFSIDENPDEFLSACYSEAQDRATQLHDINVENQGFYEGTDQELEKRRGDKRVERSAIFVPLTKPAIDTRVSNVITRLDRNEQNAIFRPANLNATDEEREQAADITGRIADQMRDSGYITDIVREHVLGAEIYRSPSCVKVGWEPRWERVAVKRNRFSSTMQYISALSMALMRGGEIPDPVPQVTFEEKYQGGRPYATWLEPGRWLYEPNVSSFNEDTTYTIDAVYLTYQKLLAMAKREGWDTSKIEANKDELQAGESSERLSIKEKVQSELGTPYGNEKPGEILVTETYVVRFDEVGRRSHHIYVRIADKYIIHEQPTESELIGFPFVPITANRMPGSIEALSSVDVGKYLQRLYNEVYNTWLDSETYRSFPPLKAPANLRFMKGDPIWGPLRIWYMNHPEQLTPIVDNPGSSVDLPGLAAAIADTFRNTLNAHDTGQGFSADSYEKATKTKLRFAGAQTRSVPTFKDYGRAIGSVAMMYLQLNQQFAVDRHNYVVNGGLKVDVPALTSVTDPETDKQELMFMYATASADPMYQSPTGKLYLRRQWEDIVRLMKPHEVRRYVPTEEEVKKDIEAAMAQAVAAIEKQGLTEEMMLEQQDAQAAEVAKNDLQQRQTVSQ